MSMWMRVRDCRHDIEGREAREERPAVVTPGHWLMESFLRGGRERRLMSLKLEEGSLER